MLYYLFPNIHLIATRGVVNLVKIYPLPGDPASSTSRILHYFTETALEAEAEAQASGNAMTLNEVYDFEARQTKVPNLAVINEVFNSTIDLRAFQERIAPGAFADVLEDDVRLLVNHEGMPLARTSNGTMTLKEDEKGLYYRAHLSDTQVGRDVYTMIKRGDLSQSSFAFTIKDESVDEDGVRVIDKVAMLIDTSIVTYPAYKASSVTARAESNIDND